MKRVFGFFMCAALLLSLLPIRAAGETSGGARTADGPVTRAELEAAVAETAFAYYFKGVRYQYDNAALDVIGREYGGRTRVGHLVQPESATWDEYQYGVCTAYAFHVYYEALGHRLLGLDIEDEFLTSRIWRIMENQAEVPYEKVGTYVLNPAATPYETDPVTENDVDICVLRWKQLGYAFNATDVYFGLEHSPHFANFGDHHLEFANGYYAATEAEQAAADEAVHDFLHNWQDNLRPGDLLLVTGHMLIYVGNGYVLDCTSRGGGRYNTTSGVEYREPNGSVYRMNTVDYYFNTKGSSYYIDGTNGPKTFFSVLRPIDALVTDDGDADPGNDAVTDPNFVIPPNAAGRQAWPGVEIDRTVSVGPYGSAVCGGTLKYSIKITNNSGETNYAKYRKVSEPGYTSAAYTALPVTETIPAGTAFLSATGGGVLSGDQLNWSVSVAAGKTTEVSYTVRVTAPVGSVITSGGGMAAGIRSNVITNTVGGAKLGSAQCAVLTELADSAPAAWGLDGLTDAVEMPEQLYRRMGAELDLPSVPQMVEQLFTYAQRSRKSVVFSRLNNTSTYAYKLRGETGENARLRQMLVGGYYGGYRFFTGLDKRWTTINHFDVSYLEPGDILVYVTSMNSTTGGVPTGYEVMLYAGKDSEGDPVLLSVSSSLAKTVYDEGADENAVSGGSDDDGDDGEGANGGSSGGVTYKRVSSKLWSAFRSDIPLFFLLRPSQATQSVRVCTGVHTGRTPLTLDYLNSLPVVTASANGPCCDLPSGSYYLAEDIDFERSIRIPSGSDVTLCLNGHSLRGTLVGTSKTERYNSDGFLVVSGTMDLCDHTGNGKLQVDPDGRVEDPAYAAYALRTSGVFNFYGGNICDSHGRYGVVLIRSSGKNGAMNMFGGVISGNRNVGGLTSGAAVELHSGVLCLYDGTITDNGADNNYGGGVELNGVLGTGPAAYMYGGTIAGNRGKYGGGASIDSGSTFFLSGGTISGNSAAQYGADVRVAGTLVMTGGTVSGEGGAPDGAGYSVRAVSGSTLVLGGTAEIRGGVCLDAGADATLTDTPIVRDASVYLASEAGPILAAGLRSGAEILIAAETLPCTFAAVSDAGQADLFRYDGRVKIAFEDPGTLTAIPFTPGDLNGDDKVNGKDITLMQRCVAGGYGVALEITEADLNGDGKLNGKDVSLLQRYIAGGYGVTLA